jgi:hypothetical protein
MEGLGTATVHYLWRLLLKIEVLCSISISPSVGINYGGALPSWDCSCKVTVNDAYMYKGNAKAL